ncbi:hypothetical protein BC826DRAFT_642947 [Russula brevipes]|nr:hypothetical protein BC826DRAFT_642947 [Russula brevipes]
MTLIRQRVSWQPRGRAVLWRFWWRRLRVAQILDIYDMYHQLLSYDKTGLIDVLLSLYRFHFKNEKKNRHRACSKVQSLYKASRAVSGNCDDVGEARSMMAAGLLAVESSSLGRLWSLSNGNGENGRTKVSMGRGCPPLPFPKFQPQLASVSTKGCPRSRNQSSSRTFRDDRENHL